MSADNYVMIFYRDGQFFPVMGFASDDEDPVLSPEQVARGGFETYPEAFVAGTEYQPEYGFVDHESVLAWRYAQTAGSKRLDPGAVKSFVSIQRVKAQAWNDGVATALNHAIRNDDGITLRLEHLDGTPWINPYSKEPYINTSKKES